MKKTKPYTNVQIASAIVLILALLWLTVSLPFVYAAQQQLVQLDKMAKAESPVDENDEGATNPFGNSTEEKAPGSISFSEEYLHDHPKSNHFFSSTLQYHCGKDAGTYIAFHGELLVPPPNQA